MAVSTNGLAKTERNQEIIRRILAGEGEVSFQDLADEYGVTRARIQSLAKAKGISMRRMRREKRKPVMLKCGICERPYVKGAYTEHCIAAGHRRLTPPGEKIERNEKIISLYVDDGYNTSGIAEHFGIPQPVVTRILHRRSIRAEGRRKRKGGLAPFTGEPVAV